MTIPQAIAELEDRDLPEVVALLRQVQVEMSRNEAQIAELRYEVDQLRYGKF